MYWVFDILELSGGIFQRKSFGADLVNQPDCLILLVSWFSFVFKYDPLMLLYLLVYLICLLPVILCLPLNFCPSVLYFITFIYKSLIALFIPLNLTFHVLVGSHLFGCLPSELCQLCIPLPCKMIQPHVLVLQPRIVSLCPLYLRSELPQLLPQWINLESFFNYALLECILLSLLSSV